MGNHQEAIAPLQESLALARQVEDGNEIGFAVWQLGRAAMSRGDYKVASDLMEESLAIYRELKLLGGVTFLLADLSRAALEQGDDARAVSYCKEALGLYWQRGIQRNFAEGLEQLGSATMYKQPEYAAQLFGAAAALRLSSNSDLFPYEQEDYDRNIEYLHSRLDENTFVRCWNEGQAMNVKQVIENALAGNP